MWRDVTSAADMALLSAAGMCLSSCALLGVAFNKHIIHAIYWSALCSAIDEAGALLCL
jgi:hypothetical protein